MFDFFGRKKKKAKKRKSRAYKGFSNPYSDSFGTAKKPRRRKKRKNANILGW